MATRLDDMIRYDRGECSALLLVRGSILGLLSWVRVDWVRVQSELG